MFFINYYYLPVEPNSTEVELLNSRGIVGRGRDRKTNEEKVWAQRGLIILIVHFCNNNNIIINISTHQKVEKVHNTD